MEILLLANFTTIYLTVASGMVIIAKIIANVSENSDSK